MTSVANGLRVLTHQKPNICVVQCVFNEQMTKDLHYYGLISTHPSRFLLMFYVLHHCSSLPQKDFKRLQMFGFRESKHRLNEEERFHL